MRRILTDSLIEWKGDPHKRPLVIQGVPQCGKTHLIKEFGSKYYKDVIYLDFEEDKSLADILFTFTQITAQVIDVSNRQPITIFLIIFSHDCASL